MTRLARVVRLDDRDFDCHTVVADAGEWAVSGRFEFDNGATGELTGREWQDFERGWLGLDSFGRASVVAVADIIDPEIDLLEDQLEAHFVRRYLTLDRGRARRGAIAVLHTMLALCASHEPNTLLFMERCHTASGIKEKVSKILPRHLSL